MAMLDTAAVEHGSNRDAQISEGLTESVLALGEIAANLEDMALSAQVLAVEAKLRFVGVAETFREHSSREHGCPVATRAGGDGVRRSRDCAMPRSPRGCP